MSDVDREALANWWVTFDGPAYPTGYEFADAILASEWLAQVKAAARAEGAREALGQAAEELGDPRTLPNEPDKPLFAVMAWLRDRARSLSAPTEGAL